MSLTTHPHIEAFEERLRDVMAEYFRAERRMVRVRVTMGPRFFQKWRCYSNHGGLSHSSEIHTDYGAAYIEVIPNRTWEGFLITSMTTPNPLEVRGIYLQIKH